MRYDVILVIFADLVCSDTSELFASEQTNDTNIWEMEKI